MNDAVVWALLGVVTTVMLGGMTLMTTLITRATTSAIDGLRAEMNARFDTVDVRIQHLDRDVSALTRRVWGEAPGE